MPSDEIHSFLPLHPLEFRILLSLLEEDPRHAYAIVKHIEASEPSWHKVLPANLYRRIRDLRGKKLIQEESVSGTEAERRKYFSITSLGRRVAREEAQRLQALLGEAAALDLIPGGGPER